MPDSLMVIFSLGGALLSRRLRSRAVRCRTAFIPLGSEPGGGPPQVMISPYPGAEPGTKGVVEDGRARLLAADGQELMSCPLAGLPAGVGRWDHLDLLSFAATTLWTWVGLPLALDHPHVEVQDLGGGRREVTLPEGWPSSTRRHLLHLDGEGRIVRHEEGGLVHHLSGHCPFGATGSGEVIVATHRRTTAGERVTVLWADVVAAAVHPGVST